MGGSWMGSKGEGRFFTILGVVCVVGVVEGGAGTAAEAVSLSDVAGLGVVEYLLKPITE